MNVYAWIGVGLVTWFAVSVLFSPLIGRLLEGISDDYPPLTEEEEVGDRVSA